MIPAHNHKTGPKDYPLGDLMRGAKIYGPIIRGPDDYPLGNLSRGAMKDAIEELRNP